ncbi:MAG: BON domain-containing protein [Aquabacterium sp.]
MKALILATGIVALSSIQLSACSGYAGQGTTVQAIDDSTITTLVKARFAQNDKVNAMQLGVDTLHGEVLLSGFADSQEDRAQAGELALNVQGVKSVRNDIVVRPTPH